MLRCAPPRGCRTWCALRACRRGFVPASWKRFAIQQTRTPRHTRGHRFEDAPFAGAAVHACALRRRTAGGSGGVFEMASGDARVVVLLEFLGKTNRLTVKRDWLVVAP